MNTIKDDLGALKFGLASLQHVVTELFADSRNQMIRLQDIINSLHTQSTQIDGLNTAISDHDIQVNGLLNQILNATCTDPVPTDPPLPP